MTSVFCRQAIVDPIDPILGQLGDRTGRWQ